MRQSLDAIRALERYLHYVMTLVLRAFEVSRNSSPKNNKSKDVTAWQAFLTPEPFFKGTATVK